MTPTVLVRGRALAPVRLARDRSDPNERQPVIDIVSRAEWGAKPPRRKGPMAGHRDRIFAHWLGNAYPTRYTDEEIMRTVQHFHQNTRGWSDFAYSFAVGRTARAFEGRGLNVAGGHTKGENRDGYAIVFLIGKGETPDPEMWETFTELVEHIRVEDKLFGGDVDGRVFGHRHDPEAATECPGDTLARWALEYKHSRDYVPGGQQEEDTVTRLEQAQAALLAAGYNIGADKPDNDFGPAMLATVLQLIKKANGGADPETIRRAEHWDRHVAAQQETDTVHELAERFY